ncbi:MAG: chorismate synthase [Candidatus Latescibacteria bacterium]|nr:chorismate synthase [Candidatus Latescibacterota bacterium]
MLRYLTAGESHGCALVGILEGLPAGLEISEDYINDQLRRRQQGYGRSTRQQIEADRVQILSGIRFGKTLGSPVALLIENKDWQNWKQIMEPEGAPSGEEVSVPRPGHADLSGAIKYGHSDIRNVLERSSARETAMRVALCTLARRLLAELEILVASHVVSIGEAEAQTSVTEVNTLNELADRSPVRCIDPETEKAMLEQIDRAGQQGDSLGGVFEVIVSGLPVGLGSYVHWDRKLDGLLAQALTSIQAIKAVEFGLGFKAAKIPGSAVHDQIYCGQQGYYRETNNAGGIEGGMTNGQPIVIRAAMKPIPTLTTPLRSVDTKTKQPASAHKERSDICAVPAASVVAEAVVAFTVANALLEKFGGDNIAELKQRVSQWRRTSS